MIKPKVFLSHSKCDIDLIHKIDLHFRQCQIDTWLDEIDIQHGDSWLRSIFDEGITKSDFVMVLISEHSIKSPMVEKEIDAGILSQLNGQSIKFMPYVTNGDLRKSLRIDLQSTQMPVLNSETYSDIFPVVVANIWNNFSSKAIGSIRKEKDLEIANLKLQYKLEKIESGIQSEFDARFSLIFGRLNIGINIKLLEQSAAADGSKVVLEQRSINLINLLQMVHQSISGQVANYLISEMLLSAIFNVSSPPNGKYLLVEIDVVKKMLQHGFLTRNFNPKPPATDSRASWMSRRYHEYEIYTFSEMFDQFMLWLELKQLPINREIPSLPG